MGYIPSGSVVLPLVVQSALLDLPDLLRDVEPGVLLSNLHGLVPDILTCVWPGGCEKLQFWGRLFSQ